MNKRVFLNIQETAEKDLIVTVKISESKTGFYDYTLLAGYQGKLLQATKIYSKYQEWQHRYRNLAAFLAFRIRRKESGQLTNFSEMEQGFENCRQQAKQLSASLTSWSDGQDFLPVKTVLSKHLSPEDNIQILLETENFELRKLPWHLCNLLPDNVKHLPVEIALTTPEFQRISKPPLSPTSKQKIRILAVFGSNIDQESSRQALEELVGDEEIQLLEEPDIDTLKSQLRSEKGWDIVFFSGHGESQQDGQEGRIELNQNLRVTISDLKDALGEAIGKGLWLAIFNCCDGLGIANQLAGQDLYLPQIIVMREAI
ncbi:MAG: CHAT domain-containing protein, partial [Moorea sp. SIO3I7]|nr:CHAT domain-containing protein [Moorena sp. SIO3I7]